MHAKELVGKYKNGERDFRGADLCGADLSRADLRGADLRGADLRGAHLSNANLSGADLRGADLSWAHLSNANLSGADLGNANLSGAHLSNANLSGADLGNANLSGADLGNANLSGAEWNYLTVGIHAAPEGALIVWGNKSGRIVKMRIEENTPRSCATTRKMRAARATVLKISTGETEFIHQPATGPATRYAVGEVTECDSWDDDRWNECSDGIHFFLTREEAEAWG